MIEKIDFIHYRKLQNISLEFKPGINIISGTNGTCKSSILHIISNSFQAFKRNNPRINSQSINIIKAINKITNPKIESLTKGDKQYNDPAQGTQGRLCTIKNDNISYNFRRHNSEEDSRFRLILDYPKGQRQTLPYNVIIYLGLSRIVPIGELSDETKDINKYLPQEYQDEIINQYRELTKIDITNIAFENNNGLKHRIDFTSTINGIDSNTISAGEDNIIIILIALVSLKFHFDTCKDNAYKQSILLIDEFDATLHPALQYKLFKLIESYSKAYSIQIVFTTHSLYLLELALKSDTNVIYLKNTPGNKVKPMENPDIYQIRNHLNAETNQSLYGENKLPIFTEDNEARLLLSIILDKFMEVDGNFARVRHFFHLSTMSLGCENLKSLFNDEILTSTTLKAIGILDGDKQIEDITHHLISLPGKDNPEQIVFKHLKWLCENEEGNRFWDSQDIYSAGITLDWVTNNIIQRNNQLIKDNFSNDSSNKPLRECQKELFNGKLPNQQENSDIKKLYKYVLKDFVIYHWEDSDFKKFREHLKTLFRKTAQFHNINPELWSGQL